MDADRLLTRLCERHGLDPTPLREYIPLVRRALSSPPGVRKRILAMVEDSLTRLAGGDATATLESLEVDLDEEVLDAVAKRLHGWSPKWNPATFGKGPNDDPMGLDGTWPGGLGGGL